MTLNEILTASFTQAHRRIGAVILDVSWKIIWLVFTGILILALAFFFYSDLGQLEVNGSAAAFQNPVALMAVARQLWQMYASTLFWLAVGLILLSKLAWIFLEAYFRAGTLPVSSDGFGRTASRHFRVFLGSSLLKILLLGGTIVFFALIVFGRYLSTPFAEWPLLWMDTRGAFIVVCLVLLALWFVLTLIETVIRGDSLELFGRELFLISGAIATLLAFEGMILVSALMALITLMALVSGPAGILVLIAAVVAFAAILTVLHSYLLVVRFSSLDTVARLLSEGSHPAVDRLQSL